MAEPADRQKSVAASSGEQLDHIVVKYVVLFLGWFAIIGLVAVTVLLALRPETATQSDGKVIALSKPDLSALIALVGSAIGALGALLAQTSTARPPAPAQQPSTPITISGPPTVTAGQTAPYQAIAGGSSVAVQWTASAGQIRGDTTDPSKAVFTAPTATGPVTITAAKSDDPTRTGQIHVQVN